MRGSIHEVDGCFFIFLPVVCPAGEPLKRMGYTRSPLAAHGTCWRGSAHSRYDPARAACNGLWEAPPAREGAAGEVLHSSNRSDCDNNVV